MTSASSFGFVPTRRGWMRSAGVWSYRAAGPAHHQPIAVVLDLMNPGVGRKAVAPPASTGGTAR